MTNPNNTDLSNPGHLYRAVAAVILLCVGGISVAQTITPPSPLQVTIIQNITATTIVDCLTVPTCIDNRSQQYRRNNYHSFRASGTGTWSVQMQYADGSPAGWTSFGSTGLVTNSTPVSGVGFGIGYHDFIDFVITGSATISNYSGSKNYWVSGATNSFTFPITPAQGGYPGLTDVEYGSLASACTAAAGGLGSGSLAITVNWNSLTTQTLACHTVWFSNGGLIQPASGQTITLNYCPQAGPFQIFDTSLGGTVLITGGCSVYPQWWGGYNSTALQAAINSEAGSGSTTGAVNLTCGTWSLSATVSLPRIVNLLGSGACSVLSWAGSTSGVALVSGDTTTNDTLEYLGLVENLTLLNSVSAGTTVGVLAGGDPNNVLAPSATLGGRVTFEHVLIEGFNTTVEYGTNAYNRNWIDVRFDANNVGSYDLEFGLPSIGFGGNSGTHEVFTDSKFIGALTAAIYLNAPISATFSGNRIEYNRRGFYINDLDGIASNITWVGGHMETWSDNASSTHCSVINLCGPFMDFQSTSSLNFNMIGGDYFYADAAVVATNYFNFGNGFRVGLNVTGAAVGMAPTGTATNIFNLSLEDPERSSINVSMDQYAEGFEPTVTNVVNTGTPVTDYFWHVTSKYGISCTNCNNPDVAVSIPYANLPSFAPVGTLVAINNPSGTTWGAPLSAGSPGYVLAGYTGSGVWTVASALGSGSGGQPNPTGSHTFSNSTPWVFTHNLNTLYPVTTCWSSVSADTFAIVNTSVNTITATPASGATYPVTLNCSVNNGSGPTGAAGANGSGYSPATSTTSFTTTIGSQTVTTQAGLAYQPGAYVSVCWTVTPTNCVEGPVTSYSGTTLILNVTKIDGTPGTWASWNINVSGQPGASGPGNNAYCADATGSGTTYTCPTPTPTVTTYSGLLITFVPQTTNSGSATLNVAALGAKTLKQSDCATNLSASALTGGSAYLFSYNGTVLCQSAGAGGGGGITLQSGGTGLGTITTLNSQSGTYVLCPAVNVSGTGTFTCDLNTALSPTKANLQSPNNPMICTSASASGTVYTAACATTLNGPYATHQLLYWYADVANTTTTPTLNIDTIGAKTLVKGGGGALANGDVKIGTMYTIWYDGTNIRVIEAGLL